MSDPINIDALVDRIKAFCQKHGVVEFSLFGSILRDDFQPGSDVDVLVAFPPDHDMTVEKYLAMREELSAIFGGRDIDLVQRRLVRNPFRRHDILTRRRVLYAA